MTQSSFCVNCYHELLDLVCTNINSIASKATFPLVPEDPYYPVLFIELNLIPTKKLYSTVFNDNFPSPYSMPELS